MEQLDLKHPEEGMRKPAHRGASAIIWGAVLALVAGNIFAIWQTSQTQNRLEQLSQMVQERMSSMNEQARAFGAEADQNVAALRDEVDQARKLAASAAGQAKAQAEKRAEQLVNNLASEYHQQQSEFSTEIGNVKQSATQAHERVDEVAGDVTNVRGEVTQTRTDLDTTRAELKSVKGDLGVQSGLIATNSKELAALRALGERQYYEFEISKNGEPHQMANVSLILRKVKPKQGRYTLDVVADDRTVSKRDRTINEPVQFYVSGARQPYEIVVNEVGKDRIVGYLAVPQVLQAAR